MLFIKFGATNIQALKTTNVGSQECDFHKSVYSQDFLINELKKIGYSIVSVAEDDIDSILISHPKSHNLNLEITVKK
jgi:hypothetical protein